MLMPSTPVFDRRALLGGGVVAGGALALSPLFPAWARSGGPGIAPTLPTLAGEEIHLKIAHMPFTVGGRTGHAVTINGLLPAPLIRLREGQNVRIHVENMLH